MRALLLKYTVAAHDGDVADALELQEFLNKQSNYSSIAMEELVRGGSYSLKRLSNNYHHCEITWKGIMERCGIPWITELALTNEIKKRWPKKL